MKTGVAKVTTVEYQRIAMGHERMEYLHPLDQSKNFEKFDKEMDNNVFSELDKYDFAISFSSIEHSGLGRYGDILDPIGDIRKRRRYEGQWRVSIGLVHTQAWRAVLPRLPRWPGYSLLEHSPHLWTDSIADVV